MLGALVAVAGFAVLFALWWRSGIEDDYQVLRIASQEFVDGHPIVAGKLAESVDFDRARSVEQEMAESGDGLTEPSDPISIILAKRFRDRSESSNSESGGTETAAQVAAREAEEKRNLWVGLRDFLVGVGRVANANRETDQRRRRRLLHDAIPVLESAQEHGFPAGRIAQGYRILGETLFKIGRYDDAISALQIAIEQDPTSRRDLLPMLAESQLKAVAPLKVQALQTIEDYLADRTLQKMQRWEGELIRLRVMLALASLRRGATSS